MAMVQCCSDDGMHKQLLQNFGPPLNETCMADWLYTKMIAAETIVFQKGDLDKFVAFGPEQHPIALQIGGNDLVNLAKATQLANFYGYDEINLNCGCPSSRVAGKGCLGVRLMLDPKFVANAMSVIAANTNVPVSVKCRICVDDHDSYNEPCDFIYKVSSQLPTKHFIIHSRKALLNGITIYPSLEIRVLLCSCAGLSRLAVCSQWRHKYH